MDCEKPSIGGALLSHSGGIDFDWLQFILLLDAESRRKKEIVILKERSPSRFWRDEGRISAVFVGSIPGYA
jgi:hypothetical protein